MGVSNKLCSYALQFIPFVIYVKMKEVNWLFPGKLPPSFDINTLEVSGKVFFCDNLKILCMNLFCLFLFIIIIYILCIFLYNFNVYCVITLKRG